MAEEKPQPKKEESREYVIPLRKTFLKKPKYKRTSIAIKAIKKYIAKHMKVSERDLSKVKIDPYFNNEVWFRGKTNPPAKVKVKATKEGDNIIVTFADEPAMVQFARKRHAKRHQAAEEQKTPAPEEAPAEEQSEEEKKEEKEKAKSAAEQGQKQAEQQARAQKHTIKAKEPGHHRMALKK